MRCDMMFITEHMCRLAIVLTILASDIILGSRALGQTRGRLDTKTITLGIVSEINQKEIVEHFQPFVRYVASRLSSASPIEGKVVVVSTLSQLAALLTERRADFYMESPHPTHLINNVYGSGKLLLRRWKGGMSDYHGVIFTKKRR